MDNDQLENTTDLRENSKDSGLWIKCLYQTRRHVFIVDSSITFNKLCVAMDQAFNINCSEGLDLENNEADEYELEFSGQLRKPVSNAYQIEYMDADGRRQPLQHQPDLEEAIASSERLQRSFIYVFCRPKLGYPGAGERKQTNVPHAHSKLLNEFQNKQQQVFTNPMAATSRNRNEANNRLQNRVNEHKKEVSAPSGYTDPKQYFTTKGTSTKTNQWPFLGKRYSGKVLPPQSYKEPEYVGPPLRHGAMRVNSGSAGLSRITTPSMERTNSSHYSTNLTYSQLRFLQSREHMDASPELSRPSNEHKNIDVNHTASQSRSDLKLPDIQQHQNRSQQRLNQMNNENYIYGPSGGMDQGALGMDPGLLNLQQQQQQMWLQNSMMMMNPFNMQSLQSPLLESFQSQQQQQLQLNRPATGFIMVPVPIQLPPASFVPQTPYTNHHTHMSNNSNYAMNNTSSNSPAYEMQQLKNAKTSLQRPAVSHTRLT